MTNVLEPNKYHKVIFLDIEGVVVTHRSIVRQHCPTKGEFYRGGYNGWHRFIDREGMAMVYKLAVDYDAQIVLTSTLRNAPETYSGLCAVTPIWLEDPTEYLSSEVTVQGKTREGEIRSFIVEHKVEKYVVLDDRDLKTGAFLQCNPEDGVTFDIYCKAKRFLADDPDSIRDESIFL